MTFKITKASLTDFCDRNRAETNSKASKAGVGYRRHGQWYKGFDPDNGTAQLPRANPEVHRLYGAWRFYERVVAEMQEGWIVLDGRFSGKALKHWLGEYRETLMKRADTSIDIDNGAIEALDDMMAHFGLHTVFAEKRHHAMADLVEAHCNAITQWGVLFSWSVGDAQSEILKACTFLTKDDLHANTGDLVVFFKEEADARAAYDTAVGEDGPTLINKYAGPAKVFAYLVGPDGKGRKENT